MPTRFARAWVRVQSRDDLAHKHMPARSAWACHPRRDACAAV